HMIVRLGERANVPGAGVHRFRHTFAVNFLRNGGNVFELQELLGHEDIKTLSVYIKLSEQDIDAAQRHSPADNWRL
ncbi:MAG: site-specific integrase, partial [Caldilineaceae bacterium]|nr:site-specific integrase [Caldilineaceae bacterium]